MTLEGGRTIKSSYYYNYYRPASGTLPQLPRESGEVGGDDAIKHVICRSHSISLVVFFPQAHVAVSLGLDGDVAQLVERRTGTPLTQVRFPGAVRQGIFLPESTFSADFLTVSVQPPPPPPAVCNRTHKHLCARYRSQTLAAIPSVGHTKTLHALLGKGSAALAAAGVLPR